MDCKEIQHLLHAYLDAELDAAHSLLVERHLQGCALCTRAYQSYQTLSAAIRESSFAYQAPPSLYKRVLLALPTLEHIPRVSKPNFQPWLSAAAVLFVLLCGYAFWTFTQARSGISVNSDIAQAVINSHEHSLLDHHLVDLSTSDPHALHAWFENKLGYSPPVIDLTLQGFALIGGRLDTLDNRVVAAIVYKCGTHVINLYAWPATQYVGADTLSLQGYDLTHWTRGGMNCWAVADLGENELQQFAHLMNQRIETLV